MDLNRTPAEIASAAAEEVRALNHRTLDPKAFTQPGDVSDVADAVATLVQRLPQTLQQLEAGLEALYDRDAIRLDDIREGYASQKDISNRVSAVRSALRQAREDLSQVHATLQRATSPLSHMGGQWEDEDDEA
jgi:uncharacterized protein YicC (UPF0701 family)